MMTKTMRENANKVAFIVEQYPEHKLPQIIALLGMPAIDINTAIWCAAEMGFISEPNAETGEVELIDKPEEWNFGTDVTELQEKILYSFKKLESKETDLEENYLSSWTAGYPSQDLLIAMKQLINGEELAEYQIEDGENKYLFYTLFANKDKLWGRKQFKEDPMSERKAAKGKKGKKIDVDSEEDPGTDVDVSVK